MTSHSNPKLSTAKTPFATQIYRATPPVQNRYAFIVSGDGLSTPLTNALCRGFSNRGMTTARVRAISYFWSKRSPKCMARDLERQLRRRLSRFPNNRFVLIGYSFGAGTLPFAINRLPADLIERIDGVALLAVPESADFEFFFRSWFNKSTKHARTTRPELEALSQKVPVLYLRGEEDFAGPSDTIQTSPTLTLMTLAGGHMFKRDYKNLVDLISNHFPPKQTISHIA